MSQVTHESFIKYSKKIMAEGLKVCPCCLSGSLRFTTDEEHGEYWLECKICQIGIRSFLFSNVRKNWNNRGLSDPRINKITHNIECSWWNDDTEETETIEPDTKNLVYSRKDLIRDLPRILGDKKLLTLIEMEKSFFLGTSDLYGNRPVDESGIITIDKLTGTYEVGNAKYKFECTGRNNEYSFCENIAMTIPYEHQAYSRRIGDELCFKGFNEMDIMNVVMKSTHFEDVDFDTMRSIVFMYIDKKNTIDMNKLTLAEKIKLAEEYKGK